MNESKEQRWSCDVCSFLNSIRDPRCHRCRTVKSLPDAAPSIIDLCNDDNENEKQTFVPSSLLKSALGATTTVASAAERVLPLHVNNKDPNNIFATKKNKSIGKKDNAAEVVVQNPYVNSRRTVVNPYSTKVSLSSSKVSAYANANAVVNVGVKGDTVIKNNHGISENSRKGVGDDQTFSSLRNPSSSRRHQATSNKHVEEANRKRKTNSSEIKDKADMEIKDPFSYSAQQAQQAQLVRERIKYVPGPVPIDEDACKDWIYPTNYPVRDYQFEISKKALFENTLVSLPTGLGKTLIAAVVMYNFYRWFPVGKVVFCAPTKPLVTQQIKACYDIMGIPAKDTAEISGNSLPSSRKILWEKRRVFFCTPQTLEHDISSGACDASQIVCIILDETHKARGDYAYRKVIDDIEGKGAKFRIVGLSATPGPNLAAVQEVIDNLRIGEICVRLESDDDVKKYIYNKDTEVIYVEQSSNINFIEGKLIALIDPIIGHLRRFGALGINGTASTMHPYTVLLAKKAFHEKRNEHSLDGHFHCLHQLLQVKSELRTHGIGVAKQSLFKIKSNSSGLLRGITKGPLFQDVVQAIVMSDANAADGNNTENYNANEVSNILNNPKLKKLCEILVEHFKREQSCGKSTRAIVFSQWRKSVEEIVSVLKTQKYLKPRKFVGQGKAGNNSKAHPDSKGSLNEVGMKQSEQEEAIRLFSEGHFNVLVCTSIGEEGLDIGQVDLIVSFDCVGSATRMIQRNGRTGRKRDGRVVLLLSKGAEEKKYLKSQSSSRAITAALKKPSSFKMKRNPILFPPDCLPVVNKMKMAVSQEYHMSQVGGYRHKSNRHKVSARGSWKLLDDEEASRHLLYGRILPFDRESSENQNDSIQFPYPLRRKYIKAMIHSRKGESTSKCRTINSSFLSLFCIDLSHKSRRHISIKSVNPDKDRCRTEEDVLSLLSGTSCKGNESIPVHKIKHVNPSAPLALSNVMKSFPESPHGTFPDVSSGRHQYISKSPKSVFGHPLQFTLPMQIFDHQLHRTARNVLSITNTHLEEAEDSSARLLRSHADGIDEDSSVGSNVIVEKQRIPTASMSRAENMEDSRSAQKMYENEAHSGSLIERDRTIAPPKSLNCQQTSTDLELSHGDLNVAIESAVSKILDEGDKILFSTVVKHMSDILDCCESLLISSHGNMLKKRLDGIVSENDSRIAGELHTFIDPTLPKSKNLKKKKKKGRILLSDSPEAFADCQRKQESHLSTALNREKNIFSNDSNQEHAKVEPTAICHRDGCKDLSDRVDLLPVHCDKVTRELIDSDEEDDSRKKSGRIKILRLGEQNLTKDNDKKSSNRNTSKYPNRSKVKRRNQIETAFIDIEAGINSDSDMDGDVQDDDEARLIEVAEEEHDSFINDSSQLGSFRDSLDRFDNTSILSSTRKNGYNAISIYHQLDFEEMRANEFSTPVLNRRNLHKDQSWSSGLSTSDLESSTKGLGSMHFIRSVINHHKCGGDADGLESEFHKIVDGKSLSPNMQTDSSPVDKTVESNDFGAQSKALPPLSVCRGLDKSQLHGELSNDIPTASIPEKRTRRFSSLVGKTVGKCNSSQSKRTWDDLDTDGKPQTVSEQNQIQNNYLRNYATNTSWYSKGREMKSNITMKTHQRSENSNIGHVTKEMKARAEANRKRALEIRARKRERKC